jgi:hypothetical protein
MKERPILFSGAMVRALLDGSKTQTRRLMKAKPSDECPKEMWPHALKDIVEWREQNGRWFGLMGWRSLADADCPYGYPGDRLWVRESFHHEDAEYLPEASNSVPLIPASTVYRADMSVETLAFEKRVGVPRDMRWTPSIHMPRKLSRILLEVTGIRIELVQAITEADAMAEGVKRDTEPCDHARQSCEDIGCLGKTHKASFCNLWCDLNGIPSWTQNPWVWVVEFKRIEVAA